MTVSDKSRKLLWGRSASRCAFCRRELDFPRTDQEPDAIVGEEGHIHSRSPNGPRYDPDFPSSMLDEYSNLILLCGVHHSLVDQRPREYSATALAHLKTRHERWVQQSLRPSRPPSPQAEPARIPRVRSGKDLFHILAGVEAFDLDYEEPTDEQEVDLVARFLQNAEDFADLADTMEAAQRVHAAQDLSEEIAELEAGGFWVFADRRTRKISLGARVADWEVAVIRIGRLGNPSIVGGSTASEGSAH